MARVNCDPYEGGHVFALVNRVTCLFDREDECMAATRALEDGGVASDDIEIFVGEKGAHCLDLAGREHGTALRLLRSLDAVTDNVDTTRRIEAALLRGGTLLSVKLHKRPLFTHDADGRLKVTLFERLNDEKVRALKVLQSLHAHEIHYWGPWTVENLPST